MISTKTLLILVVIAIVVFYLYKYFTRHDFHDNQLNNANKTNDSNFTDLPIVRQIDLVKYSGTWHEICRLPNSFQDFANVSCDNSTAQYSLNNNGTMSVLNSCKLGANDIQIAGVLMPAVNTKTFNNIVEPAQFTVQFNGVDTPSQYNIIFLDPDYQYSVVASTNRKYLWILTKLNVFNTEFMTGNDMFANILKYVKQLGFNVNDLHYNTFYYKNLKR